MGFQQVVKTTLNPGPQNAHLASYELDGKLSSKIFNSSRIQVNGNIDLNSLKELIQTEADSKSPPLILGISFLGRMAL